MEVAFVFCFPGASAAFSQKAAFASQKYREKQKHVSVWVGSRFHFLKFRSRKQKLIFLFLFQLNFKGNTEEGEKEQRCHFWFCKICYPLRGFFSFLLQPFRSQLLQSREASLKRRWPCGTSTSIPGK